MNDSVLENVEWQLKIKTKRARQDKILVKKIIGKNGKLILTARKRY